MQNKIKLISKDYYENYNKNVLEFFKDKPDKLLIMNEVIVAKHGMYRYKNIKGLIY